jgi:hypothetical protein
MNVEVREVRDEDDVRVRQASRLPPKSRPHLGDTKRQQRRAKRLPGSPQSAGRVEWERHVALDNLVIELSEAVEEDLHARLLPEAIAPEAEDSHRG